MGSVRERGKNWGLRTKLLAAAVAGSGCLMSVQAHATFTYTTSSFFTVGGPGAFTFTYLGKSAADTDTLTFTFDGQTVFINQTTPIGTQITIPVAAAGTYPLTLSDANNGDIWSSNPALNSDGGNHLAETSTFSDFGIGSLPSVPGNASPYFGFEDSPIGDLAPDYNDLVFTETFTPSVVSTPEPASLALLAAGLLGLGAARRRR